MEMTEISRHQVGEVIEVQSSLSALAESAKTLLGYDVLAKSVEKSASLVAQETTLLRQVLASLEIDVLDVRDVARYQKERLIERTTEKMREWMESTAKRSIDQIREYAFEAFSGPNWVLRKVEEYKQPIPEFVLAKAVQIKEKMPEAVIIIESLQDHPDPFLIVGDGPARYSWEKPKEHYYVEVWAEPKFEGRVIDSGVDIPF